MEFYLWGVYSPSPGSLIEGKSIPFHNILVNLWIDMGLFGKIGEVFNKIELEVSNDPAAKGKWFENYVENLFSKEYFRLVEKTHSYKTDTGRFVESNINPDFIFEYAPTRDQFAVECKFRTQLNNKNQLEWSYPAQLKRYQEFSRERRIPVFIIIGLSLEDDDYMFNIPLSEAKYPALYESVFEKYERDIEKPFFWDPRARVLK